jgi:hypothetical protein
VHRVIESDSFSYCRWELPEFANYAGNLPRDQGGEEGELNTSREMENKCEFLPFDLNLDRIQKKTNKYKK